MQWQKHSVEISHSQMKFHNIFFSLPQISAKHPTNTVWNDDNELAGSALKSSKLSLAQCDILSLSLCIWHPILSSPIILGLISIFSDALKKKNQNHFLYTHLWDYRV